MRHFCGIETYKSQLVHAAVILQSIPYDGTSTWGKGADKGFNAFMDALDNMEVYDIETNSEVYKRGFMLWKNSRILHHLNQWCRR